MKNTLQADATDATLVRKQHTRTSYQAALDHYKTLKGLARISWATWLIISGTLLLWCLTETTTAQAAGAHTLQAIFIHVANNAIDVHDNDTLSATLTTYGAKDNALILQGQYWRFITPTFLHANALHVGLNMLNLAILGIFLERLFGHLRFLLIYLVTGIVSTIASFYFNPQELSVGASGAIFGLVGAYSLFVFTHRRAFPRGGVGELLWLMIIIGINLGSGLFIQNVDNYAHLGGFLSGCLLGCFFAPQYKLSSTNVLTDRHALTQRWPLALLTILGTLVMAILALYLIRR